MKTRIPADVERLMWLVAESNDPAAIADFENRFPAFRTELAVRRRMVADLKGAKSHAGTDYRIPAFQPRATSATGTKKGTWILVGVAFAGLAFASYSITRMAAREPVAPPKVEPVVTTPVKLPETTINAPSNKPYPPIARGTEDQQVPPNQTQTAPPTENLKDLKLSNTSLVAALKMIGEMAGYRVEIAPGFEDKTVSIDYSQVTTADMLQDMGRRFGFTAFDQGDRSIIIVPAVDNSGASDEPTGIQRQIND